MQGKTDREKREEAYQRVYRMAEEIIAAWPAWKRRYAEQDSEFFASYKTQMAREIQQEEEDARLVLDQPLDIL